MACLVLIAAGCSSGQGGLGAGDAATLAGEAPAEVSFDGADWESRDPGAAIPSGARVRATAGEVAMELRGGAARLSPGSTAVVEEDHIEILRGELLLETARGITARWADTDLAADGVVRLTAGLSARVAVYRGTAVVQRPAQEREVAGLRELDLSAFRLAGVSDPLRYQDNDAWDQELVGDAIAFDGEAARMARGIDVEFGSAPRRPSFYREFAGRRLVPLLESTASVTSGPRFGPPSDVLLTLFMARAATAGSDLAETVQTVAGLRTDGARWGLVAMEFDVGFGELAAQIDDLQTSRLALADRTGSPPPPGGGDGGGDGGASGGAAGGDDGADTTGSGGDGGDASPPSGSDDGGPPGGGGNEGGGDNEGGDDPPPPDDDDTVDQVVSDVVTTVEDTTGGGDVPQDNRVPDPPSPPLP